MAMSIMFTLIYQLVLFITAVMACRVCAVKGHQTLGFVAATVLECGYLLMGFGTTWMGFFFIAVGALIVLWCLHYSRPLKSTGIGKAT